MQSVNMGSIKQLWVTQPLKITEQITKLHEGHDNDIDVPYLH